MKNDKQRNTQQSNANLNTLKNRYRLPATTTPEELEMHWSTVLNFGNHVLLAGFYFANGKNNYFGATYRFTTADHTCEGEIRLEKISDRLFSDNGTAIAWCIENCH